MIAAFKKMPVYCRHVLVPLHLLGLMSFFLSGYHLYHGILIFFFWFLFGGIGIEVGSHRLFAHRTFKISQRMQEIIAVLSCYGGQWSPMWWAALHRGIHHKNADNDIDLHSPTHGFWHAYMGWYFTLDAEKVNFGVIRDLMKSPVQRFLHKHYTKVFWAPFIVLAVFDFKLALCVIVWPALLSIHQENLINTLGHLPRWGYRNHATTDQSTNNAVLGLTLWGAGYHNNHHQFPHRYDFSDRAGEFDICRWLVPAIIKMDKMIFDRSTPKELVVSHE